MPHPYSRLVRVGAHLLRQQVHNLPHPHLQSLQLNMSRTPMRKALLFVFVLSLTAFSQTTKPRVTLDEYFNSVEFTAVRISPDGNSVVIGTERADWKHDRFRDDLWLWRNGSLALLTQSGH